MSPLRDFRTSKHKQARLCDCLLQPSTEWKKRSLKYNKSHIVELWTKSSTASTSSLDSIARYLRDSSKYQTIIHIFRISDRMFSSISIFLVSILFDISI